MKEELEELSKESDANEVAALDPIISYEKNITLTKQLKTFAQNNGDAESLNFLSKLELRLRDAILKKKMGHVF